MFGLHGTDCNTEVERAVWRMQCPIYPPACAKARLPICAPPVPPEAAPAPSTPPAERKFTGHSYVEPGLYGKTPVKTATPEPVTASLPPPPPPAPGVPTWVWLAGGAVVLGGVAWVATRKRAA